MISFVIPAYDEEALLPATLRALAEAAQPLGIPFEVIVVNDASTDRTGEVARSCGARVIDVRHRQIAATRNTGAREAGGDILVFVDADTRVSAAVVRGVVDAIAGGAVGGGSAFRFDGRLPLYGRGWLRRGTVWGRGGHHEPSPASPWPVRGPS